MQSPVARQREEIMAESLPQKLVFFYDDELIGMLAEDGTIYVPFNRLCKNPGLDRVGQKQRIQRHEVLRDTQVTLTIETPGEPWMVQCLHVNVKGCAIMAHPLSAMYCTPSVQP